MTRSPTPRWTVALPADASPSFAVDGTLVVIPLEQKRLVLDAETGETLRLLPAERHDDHRRVHAGGLLVRFTRKNRLAASREARWRYPKSGELDSELAGGTELTVTEDSVLLWGSERFCVLERATGE